MSIVMCFGIFDGLHAGHEDYFKQAREHGDKLFVVVARDTTVLDLKGELPRINETDRLSAVGDHELVEEVFLLYAEDKYRIIEEIQPEIICLSDDQDLFSDDLDIELTRRGLATNVVRCTPYFPEEYKSSLLRGARVSPEGFQEEEEEEEGIPL